MSPEGIGVAESLLGSLSKSCETGVGCRTGADVVSST